MRLDSRFRSWASGCALLALVTTVQSQPPITNVTEEVEALPIEFDLFECVSLARQYSPTIRRAREFILEREGVSRETRAARLPRLGAGGTYAVEEIERLSDFGSGTGVNEETWEANLEASLNLFTGGRLKAQYRSSLQQVEAARAQSQAVENDVLLQVALRYYAALLARQQIEVQEEAIRLFELQLERAQARKDTGAGSKFDVLQADVALANAKPPLVRVRNDYRVSVDELRGAIGLPYAPGRDASGVILNGDWPKVEKLDAIETVVELGIETRPELKELAALKEAADDELVAARRERVPSLQAFAGYQILNDRFSPDDDILQGWGGGLRAIWPIWEGGAIGGRVAQNQSRLNQVTLEEADVRVNIEVQIRRAWFDVEEASEILLTADRVIEQAGEALRLAENRYKVGGLTQLDVLQSQLELTRARLVKAQAAHDYHAARARLRRAQGLTPISLPGEAP